ncbi:MAG TPA: SDR family oxidoreductase [Gemmatimonadaceae bacterium]|nr:SDR family oxidoreductase [Gemmatimonadaceae bacterium]
MSNTTAASGQPLKGRTALVSGASRGIGAAIVRVLHGAGASVILLGRDTAAMSTLAHELGPQSPPPSFAIDLASPDSVRATLARVRSHLEGAPDIVVNNAGQFFLAPLERTSLEEFQRTLAVNLSAQFAIAREFVPDMRRKRRGHLVTIGSIADHRAFPENAAYAASKYGVRGLHEVLREELRGSGVRATLVSPGPVDTSLWDDVNPDARPGFTPRAAMLQPAAVADAVRYAVTCADDVNVDELRLSRA